MCQATKSRWVFDEVMNKWVYHKMAFITLTVSSKKNITAKEAYPILLKPFIRWMREVKGIKLYIWKAELQQRGQIHYHITTPGYIHYKEIADKWNGLQRDAGLLDEYAKEHKHYNAPSTDVHETRKVKEMANYLCKELSKTVNAKRLHATTVVDCLIRAGEIPKEKRQQFIDEYTGEDVKTEGKIWGCAECLEGVPYFATPLTHDVQSVLEAMRAAGETSEKKGDWWSIVYFSAKDPPDLLSPGDRKLFDQHIESITNEDADDITKSVPAAYVPTAQKEVVYTWEQLSMHFN